MWTPWHTCRGQRTTCRTQFSSYRVGPWDWTQVVTLGSTCCHPLSHLASPGLSNLNEVVLTLDKVSFQPEWDEQLYLQLPASSHQPLPLYKACVSWDCLFLHVRDPISLSEALSVVRHSSCCIHSASSTHTPAPLTGVKFLCLVFGSLSCVWVSPLLLSHLKPFLKYLLSSLS